MSLRYFIGKFSFYHDLRDLVLNGWMSARCLIPRKRFSNDLSFKNPRLPEASGILASTGWLPVPPSA